MLRTLLFVTGLAVGTAATETFLPESCLLAPHYSTATTETSLPDFLSAPHSSGRKLVAAQCGDNDDGIVVLKRTSHNSGCLYSASEKQNDPTLAQQYDWISSTVAAKKYYMPPGNSYAEQKREYTPGAERELLLSDALKCIQKAKENSFTLNALMYWWITDEDYKEKTILNGVLCLPTTPNGVGENYCQESDTPWKSSVADSRNRFTVFYMDECIYSANECEGEMSNMTRSIGQGDQKISRLFCSLSAYGTEVYQNNEFEECPEYGQVAENDRNNCIIPACEGGGERDCLGVCNGSAEIDCLGVCNGSAEIDCDGNCNGSNKPTVCNKAEDLLNKAYEKLTDACTS